MIVYHGSIYTVETPILTKGKSNYDFGQGFYVTTIKIQAEKWAKKRAATRGKDAIVNCYEFNESNLKILKLNGYCREWLNYVIQNRSVKSSIVDYDVVLGNVADDDVANAVDEYVRRVQQGRATETQYLALMEELSFATKNDQYCIKTEKGLANLKFVKSYEVK